MFQWFLVHVFGYLGFRMVLFVQVNGLNAFSYPSFNERRLGRIILNELVKSNDTCGKGNSQQPFLKMVVMKSVSINKKM